MDEVGGDEFREEGGQHICKQDKALGNRRTDEVDSRREDDNVADIVDNTCRS